MILGPTQRPGPGILYPFSLEKKTIEVLQSPVSSPKATREMDTIDLSKLNQFLRLEKFEIGNPRFKLMALSREIWMHQYLDDLLIRVQSQEEASHNTKVMVNPWVG